MKPVMLKIAGLHSFREEQEIPFERLSELGVFGIFGPTGSGKSSILDAMTLALYGTVVRAGRRTQGILNHAEKHVTVIFSFSLGQGNARRLYRVERRYARKDQLAVTNTHSRLILINDSQEELLADKDREVTEQITGLLGLKEEDFTRAVVLPQGKFAEFLNLGGKERREMLQRLFSLEQYGNVLINKVNDRVRTAETGYIEVESEQKGLGDASPAAIAKAQAGLLIAARTEEQALQAYRLAEARYTEAKTVHNLQEEITRKQAELTAHRQQEPAMQHLAAALEQAEKAERAAGVLAEFLTSQTNEQAAAALKRQTVEQAARLAAVSKELNIAYNSASEVRSRREPELIEQRTKLAAARQLEEQVIRLQAAAAGLAAQQQQQQLVAAGAGESLAQQTSRSQQLEERLKKLEQQLTAAGISAVQRAKVQECVTGAQLLRQNLTAAEKIKQAEVLRKQQCEQTATAARQAEGLRRQIELRLNTLTAAEAKTVESQLQAAADQLDQLLSGEKHAAAIRLAGELTVGQPCPVCGSDKHPCPAVQQSNHGDIDGYKHFEQEIAAAKQRMALLTQTLAETGKMVAAERQSLADASAAAAALSQQAASASAELDKIRTEYGEARAEVNAGHRQLQTALQAADPNLAGQLTVDGLLRHVEELAAYISNQDMLAETLVKQLANHRQEYEGCQREISILHQRVQAAAAGLAAITARVSAAQEQVTAKQQELMAITRGLPASQLLARTAQALETVRREEELAKNRAEQAAEALIAAEQEQARVETSWLEAVRRRELSQVKLEARLREEGFADVNAMTDVHLPAARREEGRRRLRVYADAEQRLNAQCDQLLEALQGRMVTGADWEQIQQCLAQAELEKNTATRERVEADKEYRDLSVKHHRWSELEAVRLTLKEQRECLMALRTLLRGNIFVEFLAQEQMELVARQASERLKQITRHRYALELNSDGGFLIRDDANGGVRRPVSTLSGGETFQAALALSLALSAQIQLKGKYPLEFFFLDEGFGSLDQQALDVAMTTLEKLHIERLTIGIISHVSELKQRLPRRLVVEPAEPAGRGSRVWVEEA
ncbi:sbcc: exonuclease SbcC [Sporomusa termitida]|uniref:Nuclease SbcCD subunit C n=2 Tax=Sporomusa termitida TaxID=2377 RepID=A0A517E0J4_9FIRM|nr:SMC family ATPase [Sporomusa termitida]QDR83122.1 sbcc: exonuclease SbcC [Sporomusa termitida]